MGRLARKRMHKNKKYLQRRYSTKKRTRDHDQIHEDLKPDKAERLLNQPEDLDLPGQAQFYCLYCAKHFVSDHDLKAHIKSKIHKRRLKELRDAPYSQAEAEAAAGMGSYICKPDIAVPQYDLRAKTTAAFPLSMDDAQDAV